MNINLSLALVDTLLRAGATWTDDFYNKSNKKAVSASLAAYPYYIKNYTGQTIWYWMAGENPHELPHGREEPMKFATPVSRGSSSRKQQISIQVQGEFRPILDISIDQVGTYALGLNPDDNMQILLSVNYHVGSKLLSLTSNFEIWNDTDVPTEVFLLIPDQINKHIILVGAY